MLKREAMCCCMRRADKQKKPYEAEWAGREERKRSLQKSVVDICSLSKEEYGHTERSDIRVLIRVKTTTFSCRHSSLSLATPSL
ncbi:MAG: hypothetical protein NVS4B11_11260 [Ktedonobacteraceae bacterium]